MEDSSFTVSDIAHISQMLAPPILIRAIFSENTALANQIEAFDGLKLASTFSGLLTVPDLQSNCLRLEALVHLAIMSGKGRKAPNAQFINSAFFTLGKGSCGSYEDPAEDMFVTSIGTSRGNFRIFEGIWESSHFYLQRIVNVVEAIPSRGDFVFVRESIYALLRLSDLICDRAKVSRHDPGNPVPQQSLSKTTLAALPDLRRRVRFSEAELEAANISLDRLSPFTFRPIEREHLIEECLGHSLLERYPIARYEDGLVVLLPTAISAAIRRFVLEAIDASGNRERFLGALAREYSHLFSRTPLIGGKFWAPVQFGRTDASMLAGVTTDIDQGRYLNIIFFIDTLDNFESTGLAGTNPDPVQLADDLDKWIDSAYEMVQAKENFREVLTLLVGCGIGRGAINYLNNKERANWRVESVSAADLFTLSWVRGFNPRVLWRMLHAQDKIESLGVTLQNTNGLLNMIAWAYSLDGHLVPHGEMPDGFIDEESSAFVVIEQNALRNLRHDVATSWDPHVERDVRGRWVNVRREGDSRFEEDRLRPLYGVDEGKVGEAPAAVFVTAQRTWWCEISVPRETSGSLAYERWKMLTVWLSKMAPVVEGALYSLPNGPVLFRIAFEGVRGNLEGEVERVPYADVRSTISVDVDISARECSIVVGKIFDTAQFNTENIAERALVDSMVEGAAMLAGQTLPESDRSALVDKIIRDASARYGHAFRAQSFRDFINNTLPERTVTIDKSDDALLKLGLGWRIRTRQEGAIIEGKSECGRFLNELVRVLENELCEELNELDRQATIEYVLCNHEVAIVDQNRWRRTAAAVLSLHDDKEATLAVMARHDFKLNAVFLATRLLAEFALCECPSRGKHKPGELDLSRLMAKAAQIFGLGGWSDAIRWDVMEPRLRITPLGDVHANLDFVDKVIYPFAHGANEIFVADAVKNYAKNLDELESRRTIEGVFEPEFLEAWKEESGASLDDARVFVDFVEDLGLRANLAILKVKRSELLDVEVGDQKLAKEVSSALVEFFTLKTRTRWRDIPAGFDIKDLQPWRFRRRLSILRRPLLQVNDEADPLLIVAPGILRDAFGLMIRGYHRGDFPARQLRSRMRRWAGETARRHGGAFSKSVAERLAELGWCTGSEIKITKLLGKGFPEDHGDVDVLAWRPEDSRVLVIECKDVQYRKTFGEIAEQLGDFRGDFGSDGKPDDLLRHLQRINLISQNLSAMADFVGQSVEKVESHLVFKNHVPMKFALERMAERVVVHTFAELNSI